MEPSEPKRPRKEVVPLRLTAVKIPVDVFARLDAQCRRINAQEKRHGGPNWSAAINRAIVDWVEAREAE